MLSRLIRDLEYVILLNFFIPRSAWRLPRAATVRVWHFEQLESPLIIGLRSLVVLVAALYFSPGHGFFENFLVGIPIGITWRVAEKMLLG